MSNRHKKVTRLLVAVGAMALAVVSVGWYLGLDVRGALMALALGAGVSTFGMVLDERLEFCDAVAVGTSTGTTLIGDVINLGAAGRNLMGQLWLVVTVDTEIITGGSAGTLEIILASDAQAAIAVDGGETHHFVSRLFVTDDAAANDAILNAGRILLCVPLPGEGPAYEQYLGILSRIGTTAITAGKINAFLTNDPSQWKALDNGLPVLQ